MKEILQWLEANGEQKNREGMARFGINSENAYGVPMPALRKKAREYRREHDLAIDLWATGNHEARIMAGLIADAKKVTPELMDSWVMDFDSWDVCDQCCLNLFDKAPFVHDKVGEYIADEREFVRRAGFVLIAVLAVHDKVSPDSVFVEYLTVIENNASDGRNFVRKAVNWALRQIGKRNTALNVRAVDVAGRLAASTDSAERWVGKDALKELSSQKTIDFIKKHRDK